MTADMTALIRDLMNGIAKMDYVKTEDIPNIKLYMDQVTTFMNEHLESSKRYEDDKILTKTMINNYSKNHLLPPSDKKKYSKEHVLIMLFIYYAKNVLSIGDIETVLAPLTKKYFGNTKGIDITDIYDEILSLEKGRLDTLVEDLMASFASAGEAFSEVPEKEKDQLQLFAFICNLCFDVYVKKMLLQKLVDELPGPDKKK